MMTRPKRKQSRRKNKASSDECIVMQGIQIFVGTIAFVYHMLYNSFEYFICTYSGKHLQTITAKYAYSFVRSALKRAARCRGGLNELKEYAKDAGGDFRLSRIFITGSPKIAVFWVRQG